MTPQDLHPAITDPLDAAKELTIRCLAHCAVLRVSRHLVGMDRDQVEKMDARLGLLLDVLNGMTVNASRIKEEV